MSLCASELRAATVLLPPGLGVWMRRALVSGWFTVGSGSYEGGGPAGTVCPVTAAAKLAGAWENGAIKPGWESWGDVDGPTPAVEEFAAWFDLCAEEVGLEGALDIVRTSLPETPGLDRRAA